MQKPINELQKHIGQTVTLKGWVTSRRSSGKVAFIGLRDGTGQCQCIIEATTKKPFATARHIPHESSIQLTGNVIADERAQAGVEIHVTDLHIIHQANDYPITRKAHGTDFLMSHRHLWLRAPRQQAILKIRHTIIQAARQFFDDKDFTLIDTPIFQPGAAEGASTLFTVPYFDHEMYLAQTGQLYLESAALALGKVYSFGPTFRAEKSKTRRHLSEFWMLEPEIAFYQLPDLITLSEKMLCHIVQTVLTKNPHELKQLNRDLAPLQAIKAPFPRMTYSEAVERLRSPETHTQLMQQLEKDTTHLQTLKDQLNDLSKKLQGSLKAWKKEKLEQTQTQLNTQINDLQQDLQNRPKHIESAKNFTWGNDFGGDDETILSKQHNRPLVITHYPREVKAFYMKSNQQDPRVVNNLDVLAPEGYGEIIGGSQREDDLDTLLQRMQAQGMDLAPYQWYLDLRRYGSVPHGGFGLGIERTVSWICGLKHIRETIPFARTTGRAFP